MLSPRQSIDAVRAFATRAPALAWLAGGTIGLALAGALYLQLSGPTYVPLFDGLTPAQGGQVIAGLQKLGIPYQLSAAGNVIEVPADQLSLARLQLGAQQLPADTSGSAWTKLEDAPLTASDLAQNAMASQALEASLQQSIEMLDGVRSAQVFIAVPRDTPFLADQPQPTASVMVDATDAAAASLGPTIAHLVAGAVPGLQARQINVSTTTGLRIFPADESQSTISSQMQVISQIENNAVFRLSNLLTPIVGRDHFRLSVAANVDFTRVQTQETLYGPKQMLNTEERRTMRQVGSEAAAIGIPGALSNEPPAATAAAPAPAPPPQTGQDNAQQGDGKTDEAASTKKLAKAPAVPQPVRDSDSSNVHYLTDQQVSDITPQSWAIKGISASIVLDKSALHSISASEVKQMVAAAFSLPNVAVTVTTAAFIQPSALAQPFQLQQAIGPVSKAVLELIAACALLFGLALPLGRRIGTVSLTRPMVAIPAASEDTAALPKAASNLPIALNTAPLAEYLSLRDEAAKNVPAVAKLLQSWTEESD